MSAVVYCCNKNADQFEAFARGFDARRVACSATAWRPEASLHIIGGLQFGALELLKRARAEGAPYVFFDRAYFGGGPGSGRLRVTFGGYQQWWVNGGALARPSAHLRISGRVELKPWTKGREQIMVVPPSDAVQKLFGIRWESIARRIAARTVRPLVCSVKGDPRPLAERLADCHAVVTWSSNLAVEAICAGVAAYVCNRSAAFPVAGSLALALEPGSKGFEDPPRLDRGNWATSLAWGQFTLAEIASGFARDVVMGGATCSA